MIGIKMFSAKHDRTSGFASTVKTISKYVSDKLHFSDVSIVSDDSCIEIISGSRIECDDDSVRIELLIKKVIVVSKSDFNNRDKLDKVIFQMKKFCDNAESIEDDKYLPMELRGK